MGECRFYLGTYEVNWLGRSPGPLFLSRRRLALRKSWPRAVAPWAMDSGGFTELQMFGRWTISAKEYADEVHHYSMEIGRLEWVAPQDWMCEPAVIAGGQIGRLTFVGTGLSVAEHQRRTVDNLLDLRTIAPDLPWVPVLQGWERDDYQRCWEMYDRAGVDLEQERLVGVGSVCRRQGTTAALSLFESLRPLRLHGFGLKAKGLERAAPLLASADSMAWSYGARGRNRCGLTHVRGGKSCANCYQWAHQWLQAIRTKTRGQPQQSMFTNLSRWSAA